MENGNELHLVYSAAGNLRCDWVRWRCGDAVMNINDLIYKEPMSGCWLWMGKIDIKGYGAIKFEGKYMKAHRESYKIYKGEIPKGLDLDHLCRIRSCVNPDHLEPVTRAENTRRGFSFRFGVQKYECNHPSSEFKIYIRKRGYREKICKGCNREAVRRSSMRKLTREK